MQKRNVLQGTNKLLSIWGSRLLRAMQIGKSLGDFWSLLLKNGGSTYTLRTPSSYSPVLQRSAASQTKVFKLVDTVVTQDYKDS